jgi:hypothetical protein
MALQTIDIGTTANDGTGDTIRDSFDKVNDNFGEVLQKDFSILTAATTPLAGTEEIAIVQGGVTKRVAVSEVGGGGGSSETFEQSRWMFNDFYSSNNPLNREPFMGVAVNGGNSSVATKYVTLASGTNANGGFRYVTNNNSNFSKIGLTFFGILYLDISSNARDRVIRMGFHTATTNVAPVNGTFVEITGSDLVFITRNASVDTTSSSITLANGATNLYEVLIHFTTATDVRCIVKLQGGAVVLDTNSTTNIPTAGLNAGIISHIVTAGANNTINGIDYMGIGQVCPTFLLDRL